MASARSAAGPRLPAREKEALRRRQKPEAKRDEKERDRVFGEKRDARDRAGSEQPARLFVLFGFDDAEPDREPGERLQRIRREQHAEDLQRAAAENRQPGEPAGVEPASEQARRMRRERHGRREGERRDEPQAAQRVKGRVRSPGDQRRQRRLIGVAPREMATADDEIELVAEITVSPVHPEVKGERRQPEHEFRTVEKLAQTGHRTLHIAILARIEPPRFDLRHFSLSPLDPLGATAQPRRVPPAHALNRQEGCPIP